MTDRDALILTRADVRQLLDLGDCIEAVQWAFKADAEGRSMPPGILGIHADDGGFHIKAAGLELSRPYFAAKLNGNFMHNQERFGLPTIQGAIILCDASNGSVLAVLDSIEITILRTGAATGVAAKYLARTDASTALICGCGNQGRVSLRALQAVRNLASVTAYDIQKERAARFADEMSAECGIPVTAVRDIRDAVTGSDMIVTCTPSDEPFIDRSMVAPGTFIAAVGADSEDKQELSAGLLASSRVVVDKLTQCVEIGDLKLALKSGSMTAADVHAELGEIIAGLKAGRTSPDETFIFDSTGTALQDVAAAAIAYETAAAKGLGLAVDLNGA